MAGIGSRAGEESFSMPLLLRRSAMESVTGTLRISSRTVPPVVHTLALEVGRIVFAASTDLAISTGESGVDWGELSADELWRATELERLELQIGSVVADLFNWTGADVAFDRGTLPESIVRASLSLPALLLRAMMRVNDSRRIEEWLGDLDQVLLPSPNMLGAFEPGVLGPEEGFLVSRIDRPMTTSEIFALAAINRSLAERAVCAFCFADLLRPESGQRATGWWRWENVSFADLVQGKTPSLPVEEEAVEAPVVDAAEAARVCYLAEQKLREIRDDRDFYAILEVERRASPERIAEQYVELAKTFHPDRCDRLDIRQPEIREDFEEVFAALSKAYVVLTTPVFRRVYDHELALRDRKSAVQTGRLTPPAAPTRPLAPAAPTAPLVAPAAPSPPPVPPPSPPPPPIERREPPLTQGNSKLASQLYLRGLEYAAANDHERAALAFERAVDMAPIHSRLYVALARSLASLPGRHLRAEEAILKAVELEPDSIDVLVEAALFYKKFGKKAAARGHLNRALNIKPYHEKALEVMKSLGEPEESTGRTGFLGRLFNR